MATPTLALIPTGYKAGKLYSVLPESGVGDFTVVRATEATRVNEAGLIETMGANVPRLDYSGGGCPVLLTEPQRTNLITYSEDFSQWTKDRVTVSENQIISPNGTLNADLIAENSENNIHRIYIGSISLTDNVDYTITVFAKKGNSSVIQLTPTSTSAIGSGRANFDLENGVLGTVSGGTASIKDYGNGWYRCSYIFESLATATTAISVNLVNDDLTASRNVTYVGSTNNNVYLWGAQFEVGSYSTSYIKTEGSAVTRNGDQVTGAGDAATFNDSEGVLMAEIAALANDLTNRYILLGTTYNNVYIRYQSSSNSLRCNVTVNGSSQFIASVFLNDETINSKISVKYKENDFSLYVNGFKLKTDLGGSTFTDGTLTELAFDNGNSNQFPFYGKTSQIQYFNTVLTDSELEKLTSWTSFIEMAQAQNYNII
jgi:hypothetical protein